MATAMVVGGATLAFGQREVRQPGALAGGWASLELVNPIQMAVVDVPGVVDAQVLQHGMTPSMGIPAAIRFVHEASGEEQIVRLDVLSESLALVRGEVTLTADGIWRMQTWGMGPEIELGRVEAITPKSGDVISALRPVADAAVACSAAELAAEVTTEILDGSFAEPLLEIPAGATVTWKNTSPVPHTVTFRDPQLEGSALLRQDDAFSATFAESGEFDYYCSPHPSMTGTVRVGMDTA